MKKARGFHLYPERSRRTKTNRQYVDEWDKLAGTLAEWRKTFAPADLSDGLEMMTSPSGFLDEIYSRQQLKSIPGMVERTRKLSYLTLADILEAESFVYLKEAANCYIQGMPKRPSPSLGQQSSPQFGKPPLVWLVRRQWRTRTSRP